jgi:hypothetical protein
LFLLRPNQTDVGNHTNCYIKNKWSYTSIVVGRDNVVVIANRYRLDGPGIESGAGVRYPASVQSCPGVHPASYTMATAFLAAVKRPGRGVEHPPYLSPRLKEE